MKDMPADRSAPRQRLMVALDEIMNADVPNQHHFVAVEGKLFGIGAESYTVGSNEFYMAYAVSRKTALCLDAGHFHPTEVVSDKISAVMPFVSDILLHVTRSVRWDSDHVVTLDDETRHRQRDRAQRSGGKGAYRPRFLLRGSINRIAAWVIGTRNMKKALLACAARSDQGTACLRGGQRLHQPSGADGRTEKHAVGSGVGLPCEQQGAVVGIDWLAAVKQYEKDVLAARK